MQLQTAVVVVGTIMVHWYSGIQKTTKPKSDTTVLIVEVRNIPCASGRNTG